VRCPGRFSSPHEAVAALAQRLRGQDRLILVAGSVFLAGAVREELKRRMKDEG
jgi:hypothetical protein